MKKQVKYAFYVLALPFFWGENPLAPSMSVGFAITTTPLPEQKPHSSSERIETAKPKQKNSLFITLEPFHIPIIRGNTPVGYMGMQIILEAVNKEAADFLENQLPRIHDLIYTDIYAICDVLWGTTYNPTLASFKKRIDHICEQYLGVDLVKSVLIENLYARQI